MSAILKFDFQKRKQLRSSEVNYLNNTKKTQFCMWQLHSPLNKGKQEQTVYPFHTPLKCKVPIIFVIKSPVA